jgi:hypothetical protein
MEGLIMDFVWFCVGGGVGLIIGALIQELHGRSEGAGQLDKLIEAGETAIVESAVLRRMRCGGTIDTGKAEAG